MTHAVTMEFRQLFSIQLTGQNLHITNSVGAHNEALVTVCVEFANADVMVTSVVVEIGVTTVWDAVFAACALVGISLASQTHFTFVSDTGECELSRAEADVMTIPKDGQRVISWQSSRRLRAPLPF